MKQLLNKYWQRFSYREQLALGLLYFVLIIWGIVWVLFPVKKVEKETVKVRLLENGATYEMTAKKGQYSAGDSLWFNTLTLEEDTTDPYTMRGVIE